MTCRRSSTPSPESLHCGIRRAILGCVEEYRLEPARPADAPQLAAMSQQFVEAGLKPAWGAVRIGWHMRDADSVVLTARGIRTVAGFAIMRYADESAHLNLLAVAPAVPPPGHRARAAHLAGGHGTDRRHLPDRPGAARRQHRGARLLRHPGLPGVRRGARLLPGGGDGDPPHARRAREPRDPGDARAVPVNPASGAPRSCSRTRSGAHRPRRR